MEKNVADCEYSGNSSKTGEFNQTLYITCFFLKKEKNYAHFDNTRWQNLHDVYMSWWTKKSWILFTIWNETWCFWCCRININGTFTMLILQNTKNWVSNWRNVCDFGKIRPKNQCIIWTEINVKGEKPSTTFYKSSE